MIENKPEVISSSKRNLCIVSGYIYAIPKKFIAYYNSGNKAKVDHAKKHLVRYNFERFPVVLNDDCTDIVNYDFALRFLRFVENEKDVPAKHRIKVSEDKSDDIAIKIKIKNIHFKTKTEYAI